MQRQGRQEDITLYAFIFRSRAERVLWTLEELQLDYQLVRLNPLEGENQTSRFLELNPDGKVPVLTHGTRVLTESLPIMEYLVDLVPASDLVPHNQDVLCQYRQLLHYGISEVESYLWIAEQTGRLKSFHHWPDGTQDEALHKAAEAVTKLWSAVEANGPYILGEDFSLADIYLSHLIGWAGQYGIRGGERVKSYLKLLASRDAYPESMRR